MGDLDVPIAPRTAYFVGPGMNVAAFGLPRCQVGSGKVRKGCFLLAHDTDVIHNFVCEQYEMMKRQDTTN